MATPTCVKCEATTFELKEHKPKGARFNYSFIHCASCGSVVGVVEADHIGTALEAIAKKLGVSL